MAKLLQAYRRYGPQVQRGTTAGHDEISAYIAESTGLDKHESRMMLGKLCDAILHYARQGRGVKLEGIISLWPKVDSKGQLSFGRRFDKALEKGLSEGFAGRIENFERRGWTEQDYRDAWNAEFPDDPIED
jgi:hypothetical protein